MSLVNETFWSNALSNAVGTLIASTVSAILIYIIFNPARRWLNLHNPKLGKIFQTTVSWIMWPYTRLFVFMSSLLLLFAGFPDKNLWFVLCFITFLSFFRRGNSLKSLPSYSTVFFDDFQNSENQIDKSKWDIVTGAPFISPLDAGHARLVLKVSNPPRGTNSFLVAKGIQLERGVIECEMMLSPNSVFNIVFFADDKNNNWHMARFESRENDSDAFLIKDGGPGINWRFNKKFGTRSNSTQWYRVRLEFNSERARVFKNGDLIEEITNPQMFGGNIGMFNEIGEVMVSSFAISKT